jgi:hypothetical protein
LAALGERKENGTEALEGQISLLEERGGTQLEGKGKY